MVEVKARAAGLSDVGRCRRINQDVFVVDGVLGLYAVADGMGGHAAGEVASSLAIKALTGSFEQIQGHSQAMTPAQAQERLRAALSEGNRRISESVEARMDWRGMGTTMVALVLAQDRAVIAHVGDSRAYLLRGGELRRLTSDHSWVNEQVRLGLLTEAQAHRHPMRHIVTRALGNQAVVEIDLLEESVLPGDVFTLCSDGLNGMLADDDILGILAASGRTPAVACRQLVELANERGGEDNITVVVVAADA
jgi:protein phosphatase